MRSAWRTVEKRCEIRIVVQCAGGGEDALEDLGLAAHVELRGRLVEQHQPGARAAPRTAPAPARRAATARPRGRCRPRSRGRAGVSRLGEAAPRRPRPARRGSTSSGAPPGATLSRSGSSKRMKSWNTAVTRARHASRSRSRRSTPSTSIAPRLRVVEPAQQLGQRRLAGAVLADDRERRAGRDREVEALEHRRARRPGRRR